MEKVVASVVIPNWNTTGYLDDCVSIIRGYELKTPYEIIVVDNASTDTFPRWKDQHPDVRVIQNDTNLGFSISIVQGILISKGKYVCILNVDTGPGKGWLDYLVDYLESDPMCGLVAPFATNVCCKAQGPKCDLGENVEIKGETIPFMCVVIPKRIFREIGLPAIRYGEDTEYNNRIRAKGYKTIVVTKAFVNHIGSQGWIVNKIGRNSRAQQEFARDVIEKGWLGE